VDRRLVVSVVGALAALGAGVAGLVVDGSLLAIAAGVCGLFTGVAAAALAVKLRDSDDRLRAEESEATRLRGEVDALSTLLSERAASANERARRAEHPGRTVVGGSPGSPSPNHPSLSKPPHPEVAPAATAERAHDGPGIVGEEAFGTLLHQAVASARRTLHPLSVVVFAFDRDDTSDAWNHARSDDVRNGDELDALSGVVLDTVRECDTVARVNDQMLATILNGATEHGAVWAVERVRARLRQEPTGLPADIAAGVACYPTHALEPVELVSAAGRALQSARTAGHSNTQIAES